MKAVGKGLLLTAMAVVGSLGLAACSSGGSATTEAESGAEATTSSSDANSDETYEIAIAQIVTHASLDAAVDGFKAAIEDAGLKANYKDFNANNDQQVIPSIAASIESMDPNLVLAVGTPIAQGLAQTITDVPILFTAVTSPDSAGLDDSLDAPGANITGTTDKNPVKEQLELIKEIVPDAKTVGVIYNPGEENSVVQVDWVKEEAQALGLEVKEAAAPTTADVQQAAESLDVDAIYLPTDNTVISAIDSVLQVGETKGIPVFAAEGDSVQNGAVATYGISYYDLGYQTGQMAVRILVDGEDTATMPVESQQDLLLYVNTAAAGRMEIEIPQDVLDRAEPETTFED